MNHRTRSFAALAIVFAVLAAGVLWWQALRSQGQLREQVLLQAEQRSLHLADAMAGQVQAQLNLIDVLLKDLREHWLRDPQAQFDTMAVEMLESLPPGLASQRTRPPVTAWLEPGRSATAGRVRPRATGWSARRRRCSRRWRPAR